MNSSFNRSVNSLQIRYLAPVTRNVRLAWRWWLGELSEILPAKLWQFVASTEQRLVVSIDGDGYLIHDGDEETLRQIGRCELLLSQDQVLIRSLTLPLAAEENLREVLSFEMDRHTPFTANHVYYDFVITERSSANKTLSLQLFVAPRDVVDQSLATLAAADIQPELVAAQGLDDKPDGSINLLPEDKRSTHGTLVNWANAALATLAILLVTTAIALPLIQKNQTVRSLETAVQEATVAAQASIELRQEVEKLVEGSSYLIRKKQSEPTVVRLLDEMTGIVPDHTWVNRIDIGSGEISIQGQSSAAAGLIALIEGSPSFGGTQFRSPLTQVVRTDQERFHLSADILREQDE